MSDKNEQYEQDWLDLLAGQSVPNADPKTVREAQLFRGALLAQAELLKNDSEMPYPHLWENIKKELFPTPLWKKIYQKIKQLIAYLPEKIDKFFPPQKNWALPTTALALLAIGVIIYIVITPPVPIDTTVVPDSITHTAYQTIYAHKTGEMADKLREFKFRWEGEGENVLAFSPTAQPSQAAKAFSAGLLFGREALLGKTEVALPTLLLPSSTEETWSKTQWADEFELGRWTILLWTASQIPSDLPPAFWDEQRWIFSQLKAAFAARAETDNEANKIFSQLENRIEPHLKQLPTEDNPRVYKDLAFDLKKMMFFLAPKSADKP
jgi:hypothetical protein